jgi:Flp pilus assembly protein TadG
VATLKFLTRRLSKSELGAELIEMAVVMPILLLLVMGIVDFGFLFQRYVVLTNAAVEGARMASMPGYTGPQAEDRAEAYAATSGVPGAVTAVATAVTLPGSGATTWPGMQVTVTHVYPLRFIAPMIVLVGGTSAANVTLTARSTMRRQMAP